MRTITKQMPKLSDYVMKISADSLEELNETVKDHGFEGWREVSRTVGRDGTYHATLRRTP